MSDKAVNYSDVLEDGWDNIPEPKLLPTGGWRIRCRNAMFMAPKSADQKPQVLFFVEAQEPNEDVSDESLKEFGSDDYSQADLAVRIFIEKPKDWHRVKTTLAAFGIDVSDYKTRKEALAACKDRDANCMIGVRSYVDRMGQPRTDNTVSALSAIE